MRTITRFLWALPCARFELSLAWNTLSFTIRRRTECSTLPMTSLEQQVVFPSWSWLGWVGGVFISVADDTLETYNASIICYIHRSNPLSFELVSKLNYERGDQSAQSPADSDSDSDDFMYYNQGISWRHSRSPEIKLAHVKAELPNLTEDVLKGYADEYLLFFWAESAFLEMVAPDPDTIGKTTRDIMRIGFPIIMNSLGEEIGTAESINKHHWQDKANSGWSEFIAIGRRCVADIPDTPTIVIALQIRWENGVAYRGNIAEINEDAWLDASPTLKLIALA